MTLLQRRLPPAQRLQPLPENVASLRFLDGGTDMHPMKIASVTVALVVAAGAALVSQAQAPAARLFEGARLITGDGSAPIENAAFVVQGNRITAVGRRGQVTAPAGAARVDLTGKTVMPAIIDTHTHLSQTKDALATDLRRRAYYG